MKILVGDSQPVARRGLVSILAGLRDDVECHEGGSFTECLDAAAKSDFDLAIIDMTMSDMPWDQGLRRLREQCDGAAIIATSGTGPRANVFKMIELGASGFVPRDAGEEELAKAINLVLSGMVYLPRSIVTVTDAPDDKGAATQTSGGAISETALPTLTKRQREVLQLLAEGKRNSEIAEILGTSEFTIRVHVSAILKGLGVANRTQAALKAQDLLRRG